MVDLTSLQGVFILKTSPLAKIKNFILKKFENCTSLFSNTHELTLIFLPLYKKYCEGNGMQRIWGKGLAFSSITKIVSSITSPRPCGFVIIYGHHTCSRSKYSPPAQQPAIIIYPDRSSSLT